MAKNEPRSLMDFVKFSLYVGGAILALEYTGALDWARSMLKKTV